MIEFGQELSRQLRVISRMLNSAKLTNDRSKIGRSVGRRERIDVLSAACLNAAGANVLDYCDTHTPTAIHPTAPIAPTPR